MDSTSPENYLHSEVKLMMSSTEIICNFPGSFQVRRTLMGMGKQVSAKYSLIETDTRAI